MSKTEWNKFVKKSPGTMIGQVKALPPYANAEPARHVCPDLEWEKIKKKIGLTRLAENDRGTLSVLDAIEAAYVRDHYTLARSMLAAKGKEYLPLAETALYIDEQAAVRPKDAKSRSKLATEMLLISINMTRDEYDAYVKNFLELSRSCFLASASPAFADSLGQAIIDEILPTVIAKIPEKMKGGWSPSPGKRGALLMFFSEYMAYSKAVNLVYLASDDKKKLDIIWEKPTGDQKLATLDLPQDPITKNGNSKAATPSGSSKTSANTPPSKSSSTPKKSQTTSSQVAAKEQKKVAAADSCLFEREYVNQELGPGFGTIIQKARLVPNNKDAAMNGFKIFAIDKNSMLAKAGLQDGDILIRVNKSALKQPKQGFVMYQAFQDENEVRLSILRRGKQKTIICRIE